MARRITYKEFYRTINDETLSDRDVRRLFLAVKDSNTDVKKWFIDWYCGDGYPSVTVEGITAEFLAEEYGMNPVNAFLTLDWLREDPRAAKYFLVKRHMPPMITEEVEAEMQEFLAWQEEKDDEEDDFWEFD